MSVLMRAPNTVRDKPQAGNIAARSLAEQGLLGVLSSDYVPLSLIHAPFVLAEGEDGVPVVRQVRREGQRVA